VKATGCTDSTAAAGGAECLPRVLNKKCQPAGGAGLAGWLLSYRCYKYYTPKTMFWCVHEPDVVPKYVALECCYVKQKA
jgi:hypothetical protein